MFNIFPEFLSFSSVCLILILIYESIPVHSLSIALQPVVLKSFGCGRVRSAGACSWELSIQQVVDGNGLAMLGESLRLSGTREALRLGDAMMSELERVFKSMR